METLQEMLQQIDWKLVIPLVTFFLGYFLSNRRANQERKRERDNIKTVLFFEIAGNHYLLTKLPDFEKDLKSKVTWAVAAQSLNYSLYKEYLGKINVLDSNELNAVLIAYNSTKIAIKDGKEYFEYIQENLVDKEDNEVDNELLDVHSENLHSTIEHTQRSLTVAVAIFVKGREDFMSTLRSMYEDLNSEAHQTDIN